MVETVTCNCLALFNTRTSSFYMLLIWIWLQNTAEKCYANAIVADSIFCREYLDDSVIGGICEGDSLPCLPYFATDLIFCEPD